MEAKFRELAELVEPGEEVGSQLLEKIGDAVKAAKVGRLHASHGYPEFETGQLPYAIDRLGAQRHGIQVPEPEPPKQKSRWLYD